MSRNRSWVCGQQVSTAVLSSLTHLHSKPLLHPFSLWTRVETETDTHVTHTVESTGLRGATAVVITGSRRPLLVRRFLYPRASPFKILRVLFAAGGAEPHPRCLGLPTPSAK